MKIAGWTLTILAYIVATAFVVIPIGLGMKQLIFDTGAFWAESGKFIIIGITLFFVLYTTGDTLRNRAKKKEQKRD